MHGNKLYLFKGQSNPPTHTIYVAYLTQQQYVCTAFYVFSYDAVSVMDTDAGEIPGSWVDSEVASFFVISQSFHAYFRLSKC